MNVYLLFQYFWVILYLSFNGRYWRRSHNNIESLCLSRRVLNERHQCRNRKIHKGVSTVTHIEKEVLESGLQNLIRYCWIMKSESLRLRNSGLVDLSVGSNDTCWYRLGFVLNVVWTGKNCVIALITILSFEMILCAATIA